MADPITNPDALATLSAMVNQTLVETGRFFRSSGSMQARNQLKRSLPPTHEQFQSSLDTLSEQIFIAKAFLEQDYEAAKEKRKARNPTPQPVPAEKPNVSEDITMEDASTAPTVPTAPTAPIAPTAPVAPVAPTVPTAPDLKPPSVKMEQTLSQDQLSTQPSEHPQPPNDKTTDIPDPPKKTPKPEPSAPDNNGTTSAPGTDPQLPGDPASMDLDSMFPSGPGEGGGGGNPGLAMEFPSDEAGDQNFLAGFSVGDNQNKPQDSMSSLLPGLENYANASGELNLNPQAGNNSAQVSPTRKDPVNNVPPGESNFDDLFMDAGNFGGNSGEDLLNDEALVEIGDLDDSWFD